ncbi:MAG: hypothetical protein ACLFTK_13270 [Anaerolineales bacterium]
MSDSENSFDSPRRNPRTEAIEARAGRALQRDFWHERILTPMGTLSRRALAVLAVGLVLTCAFLGVMINLLLTTLPQPPRLPVGDATTVMTHIHANYSGNKDAAFVPFQPEAFTVWRYDNAQTFSVVLPNGLRRPVVVASYTNPDDLRNDYLAHTAPSQETRRIPSVISRLGNLVAEMRTTDAYNPEWRAIYLSNLMLLASPEISRADWEELQSHFLSIVAATQREAIPTPTP